MTFIELQNTINSTLKNKNIEMVEIPTLGARVQNQQNPSYIRVFTEENGICFYNNAGRKYSFDETLYNEILKRWNELGEDLQLRSGQYSDPIFTGGNRVLNPYIATILAEYID